MPLSDVRVDAEMLAETQAAVASGWWSMGPRVAAFEQAFAEFCGTEHALATASCTASLHMALQALGVAAGDEVVLPSLTFVAAANVVRHVGATPVFCDVMGVDDLNLDPGDLEAAIGPNTKALVVLHYGGFPCDMERVLDTAERHGIPIIEDAAHAPGATWRRRSCGSIGAIGCFSFFSNKNLPLGEGGMVVTDDELLAERMRLLRSHGMTTLTWDRHRGHAHSYDVVMPGFNYRLDELRAALGLVQLPRLEAQNAARGLAYARYAERLHGRSGITMPFAKQPSDLTSSYHLAVVILPAGSPRDVIREALRDAGIQTSVHYPPIHAFTAYSDSAVVRRLDRTDELAGRLLTLPLFPHLELGQIDLVCDELLEAVAAVSL